MPIRHVSWQRRAHETPAVAEMPETRPGAAQPGEPVGWKRLLYARPLGSIPQLLLGLVGLILLVHGVAWLLQIHLAWIWGAVALAAGTTFFLDWRTAKAAPLDATVTRRAALTSRILVLALVGLLFSSATF